MSREHRIAAGCVVVYAAFIIVIRRPYGGDIVPEILLSQRWLDGLALYRPALSTQGTPWPPFAALALAPLGLLARVSLPVAIAVWSALSVTCLAIAVLAARRLAGGVVGWRIVGLALAATAVPIETNFEHRNVNTILLLLIIAAAVDLEHARDRRAGLWVGLAAAIKAFPALLIPYFAIQRRWSAFGVAVAVAAGGTLLALVPYGPAGAWQNVIDWLQSSFGQAHWQLSVNDQSLRALVLRLGGTPALAVGVAALCALLVLISAGTRAWDALSGLGAVLLASVLAAPIAWTHYYVLAFPAWLAVLRNSTVPLPVRDGLRSRRVLLIVAAVATSGVLTIGPRSLRHLVLETSAYAWGSLLVLAVLEWSARRSPRVQEHD
jgi:alpha-1,2-mannosyltransferase